MKKKKIVALLMTASVFATLLSGCGSSDTTATEGKAETETGTTAETTSAETESGTTAAGEIQMPLTEEPVTLTVWMPVDSNFMTAYSDYNEGLFFQKMEELTGVHLEFETPVVGEEQTAFNLMIASGELPDIICYPNYYSDGLDAAIDDGYYLDLTPYLDTYLANYDAARNTSEVWQKDTVTDTGRTAALYTLLDRTKTEGGGAAWGGLQIRQDWLDDLGLEVPTTYAELEEVLTAFKEEKGAYAPLALCSKGNYYYGEMSAGFGVTDDFMNVDGTVAAGFITDEWREYLRLMNDWYEKGLIDPDFMTNSRWMVDTELVTTGASGVWWSMYTMPSAYEATDENMVVAALPSPKMNEDDILHFRLPDSQDSYGVAISANCEHVEIALQWLDYLYTEEGARLANYGVEGDTYTVDADGEIDYTDKILHNPDGLTVTQALMANTLVPDKIPYLRDAARESKVMPEKDQQFIKIWSAEDHLDDWVMPSKLTMTSDESTELASMYTDIQTYYKEASCQFITGVLDIDSDDWNNYVEVIKGMGIDRCVEIEQAALDRYLVR